MRHLSGVASAYEARTPIEPPLELAARAIWSVRRIPFAVPAPRPSGKETRWAHALASVLGVCSDMLL